MISSARSASAGLISNDAGSGFAGAIQWMADEGITQGCNPPANTTTTLVLYLYEQGFRFYKLGYASAIALAGAGAFVGIHNAFGTEYNWPWYEGLLGNANFYDPFSTAGAASASSVGPTGSSGSRSFRTRRRATTPKAQAAS